MTVLIDALLVLVAVGMGTLIAVAGVAKCSEQGRDGRAELRLMLITVVLVAAGFVVSLAFSWPTVGLALVLGALAASVLRSRMGWLGRLF